MRTCLTTKLDLFNLYPRQVVGSRKAALETLLVLRQVVSKSRFTNIEQLVEIIRAVGRRLVEAQPKGHSSRNPRKYMADIVFLRTFCWKHSPEGLASHPGRISQCCPKISPRNHIFLNLQIRSTRPTSGTKQRRREI